jgi:hypothetical protein
VEEKGEGGGLPFIEEKLQSTAATFSPLQQFIEHVVSATVATLGGHFWRFLLGFGHGSL